jgi:hypothetical protein
MTELRVPTLDFSSLGELPDVYRNARTQATREMTLANLGRDGNVNYEAAAASLFQNGDFDGGLKLAQLGKVLRGDNSYYGTPIYGTRQDGSTAVGTFDKRGQFKEIQTPGFTPTPGVKMLNTGTGFVPVQTKTGQPVKGTSYQPGSPAQPAQPAQSPQSVGFIPIDVAGEAAARVVGQASGKAEVDYPKIVAQTTGMLKTIDGILNDPGLSKGTGLLSIMQRVPNTDAYRFGTRVRQLQGQAFLQAFESLKGGGQITEIEGTKATDAIGRLDTAQSEKDYREALEELRDVIQTAQERARQGITVRSNATGQTAGRPMQQRQSGQQPSQTRTIGGKNYIKVGDQWFEQ